ncbi:MAG: lysophospholipid acyltransferase family protein [Pseudomonadota bacterium]
MQNTIVPFLLKCLGYLPLGIVRVIGILIGKAMWSLKGRDYRVTLKNIQLCFPELEKNQQLQLVRESLIETAKTAAEAGVIWHKSWAWLQTKIVAVEGEDILRAELGLGKGLIVLAPHLGNWEVVAPYLASIAPLTAMYKPLPIPKLDKLVYAGRSKLNINMAPTNRKGVSMLLKALQAGTIVGVLPDQNPEKGAGGEAVPFFGRLAMTMSLVHSLMNRTQCRVVAVFAMRVAGGYKLITTPVVTEMYSENIHESLQGMNKSIEQCVRMAPVQYQWEYNRFRKLPAVSAVAGSGEEKSN